MTEKLENYIRSVTSPEPEYLSRLLRDSYVETLNGRMNSGHVQGRLLKMLVTMISPSRILELGTFCGYSALCMAEGLMPGAEVVTIEVDDEKEDFILRHLEESGLQDRVRLLIGDCLEMMRGMEKESFGLIFIDADKRDYPEYLQEAARLTKSGGYIIADNTLWDGHVVDENYTDRQTCGIREFNRMLADMPGWECVVIPVRDGLSIARKLPAPPEC